MNAQRSAAQHAWFAGVFDQASEAMLVIAPHQDRIVQANAGACELLGYSRDELLGRPASSLHASELPALIVFTQSVIENGSGWTNELSCISSSGEHIPIEYSASCFRDQGRDLLIATLRDKDKLKYLQEKAYANVFVKQGIAEWKRVEKIFKEIEHENQLILRAAGEGIYGVNSEGNTTFVNPAAERMLGWNAEELVGQNTHCIIHHTRPDGAPYGVKDCPIFAAFQDGEVHTVDDEVFWCKDGTPIPVEYTSTPIRDHGVLVGAVVIFRDISERKRAEAHLRAALAEVEELKHKLEMENAYLQEEIGLEQNTHEIVGASVPIQQVIRQIQLVGPTDANVLITGDSGTGKELIARALHNSSMRKQRPLIRVNCAVIPRDLFESEFFGHIKGAFTGAVSDRIGRFELADGGTLFLDEVGEIPLDLQSKLLRVLQEGQFERVGDNQTRKVDVRIIAATNRDLKTEVSEQRFREDLYFRLNVFPIESAPLRERLEDVPLLAMHFLKRACQKLNRSDVRLTHADIERLQRYHWPGNIRELGNVIERAVIVSRNGRLKWDLPTRDPVRSLTLTSEHAQAPTVMTWHQMRDHERSNIITALQQTQGKVFGPDGAAELLGIKPTTLASRIKRMGIDKRSWDQSNAAN